MTWGEACRLVIGGGGGGGKLSHRFLGGEGEGEPSSWLIKTSSGLIREVPL